MIKILVLDDHELFGIGIKNILEQEENLKVEKFFSDPEHMDYYITKFKPHIILCDIKIKDTNGLDIIKEYKSLYPKIKFIALSGYDIDTFRNRAFENGASAYVLKEDSTKCLIEIIHKVYASDKKISTSHEMIISELTPEEIDILNLMSQDLTNTQISLKAYMSKRTIEYHVSNIIRKLNVNSRLGAVIKGLQLGLIEEKDILKRDRERDS